MLAPLSLPSASKKHTAMIGRRFLAALALAHGAAALFEGFVDVLVRVDVQVTASDIFSGVLNAAGRDDDGYDACVAANDVLNVCYDDGYLAPTAQIGAANNCVCCLDTTPISKVYSACASYALEQGPGASRAYSSRPPSSLCGLPLLGPDVIHLSSRLPNLCHLPAAGPVLWRHRHRHGHGHVHEAAHRVSHPVGRGPHQPASGLRIHGQHLQLVLHGDGFYDRQGQGCRVVFLVCALLPQAILSRV